MVSVRPILHLPLLLAMACIACGSGPSGPDVLQEVADGNFVLYVSNQSFAIDPVDITILVDGRLAVSDEFEVGNQHGWVRHQFDLAEGHHEIEVASMIGESALRESFDLDGRLWAVVDYWFYPDDPETPRHFTFQRSDQPLVFQ